MRKRTTTKTVKTERESITLPTEFSEPAGELTDYPLLVYGREGVGKTSLFQSPDTFYLLFEPTKALRLKKRDINTWKEFKQYLSLLEKDQDLYKRVIIDTVDLAYELCFEYVCKQQGFEHPGDEEYGKGWNAISTEFANAITRLCKLKCGVVFISHANFRKVKRRSGLEYDVIEPAMKGQARKIVEPIVDMICYYGYSTQDDNRVLTILGTDHLVAKNKIDGHFLTPEGTPIETIPMGDSAQQAHDNFVSAFNNELSDGVIVKGGDQKKNGNRSKTATGKRRTKKIVRRKK